MIEIIYQGVSYAVIVKKYFFGKFELVPQIRGKAPEPKDNKTLFQNGYIAFDGIFIDSDKAGKFRIRYLVSNLQSKCPEELYEQIRFFDISKAEYVFEYV